LSIFIIITHTILEKYEKVKISTNFVSSYEAKIKTLLSPSLVYRRIRIHYPDPQSIILDPELWYMRFPHNPKTFRDFFRTLTAGRLPRSATDTRLWLQPAAATLSRYGQSVSESTD